MNSKILTIVDCAAFTDEIVLDESAVGFIRGEYYPFHFICSGMIGTSSNHKIVLGDRKSILDIVEFYQKVYKVQPVTENLGSVDDLAGVKLPEGQEYLVEFYSALSK